MAVTERSLYHIIIELMKQIGERHGINVTGIPEISLSGKYPDIILHLDSHNLLVQVKIDSVEKILDDLTKTYPLAKSQGAGILLFLFSSEVREILPTEINRAASNLNVKRALLLTEWASEHLEERKLKDVIETVMSTIEEYKQLNIPIVDYITIAHIAREVIEELSSVMRSIIIQRKLLDQAQAIVGSFDFYRSLLQETVEKEEIMYTYIADIVAYITVISLLFLHVASIKKYRQNILPYVDNPLSPPKDLLDILDKNVRISPLYNDYQFLIKPFLYILSLLKNIPGVINTLTRYLFAIQALKPEHVKEELLGRIYQEGLPPNTRKNLGAFFTNPTAARILAYLAIEKYDEKVLDPACGSGTLLVSSYEAKMNKALQQELNRSKAHMLFLKDQIVGIDIMQFAKELASINLTLQDIGTPIEPKIYWGDGIEKMQLAIQDLNDDPPLQSYIEEWIEKDREKYRESKLQIHSFDLVIMNPPFTRRERIPSQERNRLDTILGEIVKGKVGYWAYFFAAADNVIKFGGKLSTVTPEEFFVGGSAESVRRFLFKGEIYNNSKWIKVANRIYIPQIIIKSAVDVAFSEQAHYRDYLVVFRKVLEEESEVNNRCVVVTLKKKLEELKDKEKDIAMQIKNLLQDDHNISTSNEFFDAVVLNNISSFIEKYIDNLKPLVFFNSMKILEFFNKIVNIQKLKRLGEVADLNDYTCQYTETGFEEYARKLFISKYETRAPTITFRLVFEDNNTIKVESIKHKGSFSIPKNACVCSLRTCTNVKHTNVSGEEEYAIIDPQNIERYLTLAGLVKRELLYKAANDIKVAYNKIAGHILLARRLRLTSTNVYWLAFYSNNRIIGPSAPMICLKLKEENLNYYKVLTLYLNSSITFLQLLAYLAMTEGAWVAIHSKQAWSNVMVPDLKLLSKDVLEEALQVFNKISKVEDGLQSLYNRYTSRSSLQKKIDKIALKMIGLKLNDEQLDTLYDMIKAELDIMKLILEKAEENRKKTKKKENTKDEEGSIQESLTEWINSES